MKTTKLIMFVSLLVGLNMGLNAQNNPLLGMWNYKGNDGSLSSNGKIFLPDGHMYGYRFNQDRTDISTWIMADYQVVNDTTYLEKCFLHSAITFQTDIEMTFHLSEDKQILTTVFTYIYPNGQHVQTLETWQRDTTIEHQKYMEKVAQEWDALYVQGRKDFGLSPDEGETIEERGEKIYSLVQNALKKGNLEAAYQLILMQAELDPTNIEWQEKAVNFFLITQNVPTQSATTPARKYAERYHQLIQEKVVSARDTTLQKSVMALYMLTNNPVEKNKVLEEHLQEEDVCNEPPSDNTFLMYNWASASRFQEKQYDAAYDNVVKAIKLYDSMEKKEYISQTALVTLKEFYNLAAMSKIMGKNDYEAAIPFFEKIFTTEKSLDEKSNSLVVLAMCYDKAIRKGGGEI